MGRRPQVPANPEPTAVMRACFKLQGFGTLSLEHCEQVNEQLRKLSECCQPQYHATCAARGRVDLEALNVRPAEREWNPQASLTNMPHQHRLRNGSRKVTGSADIGTWPVFKDRHWYDDPDVANNGLYQKVWWAHCEPGQKVLLRHFPEDKE